MSTRTERAPEGPGLFYPDDYIKIEGVCTLLSSARSRGALGLHIAREIERYSMFDLQVLSGRLLHEVSRLPSPYREAIRPYFIDQVFGTHHLLLSMKNKGIFARDVTGIKDPAAFYEYCRMIPAGCFSWDDRNEYVPQFYTPYHRLFYYLISAFTMFVQERPGHPVGTPFPGGFKVVERKGEFFCPVRDKEKEVFFSICNYCPAKQSEVP